MACQIESIDTEFLTMVFRAIMGQKLAIWPTISSRWAAFWAAVRRWPAGISAPALSVEGSSVKPRFGAVLLDLSQLHSGAKKGAKLGSKLRV